MIDALLVLTIVLPPPKLPLELRLPPNVTIAHLRKLVVAKARLPRSGTILLTHRTGNGALLDDDLREVGWYGVASGDTISVVLSE